MIMFYLRDIFCQYLLGVQLLLFSIFLYIDSLLFSLSSVESSLLFYVFSLMCSLILSSKVVSTFSLFPLTSSEDIWVTWVKLWVLVGRWWFFNLSSALALNFVHSVYLRLYLLGVSEIVDVIWVLLLYHTCMCNCM